MSSTTVNHPPNTSHFRADMTSLIKINPFSGGNPDISEDVDVYLDDIMTAAMSWDLSLSPGILEATNKSKI